MCPSKTGFWVPVQYVKDQYEIDTGFRVTSSNPEPRTWTVDRDSVNIAFVPGFDMAQVGKWQLFCKWWIAHVLAFASRERK